MRAHRFHGLELPVRSCSGARAIRVIHPANQQIDEHRHDWPLITIPRLGGYRDADDDGIVDVDGPAIILHPPGRCHANCIHASGMETFSIEFDPDWLGVSHSFDKSYFWQSGTATSHARAVADLWSRANASECDLRAATVTLVTNVMRQPKRPAPTWFDTARHLAVEVGLSAEDVARRLDLHPEWFARAYRAIAGEGPREAARRRMLERAVRLLRDSELPIAEIALASGFCDQSHLNRALKAQIGRTPHQIRSERTLLRSIASELAA